MVDAAKQGSVISNIAFTAAHQQLIYSVALAFYNHAAAQARLDTATQSLKNAQTGPGRRGGPLPARLRDCHGGRPGTPGHGAGQFGCGPGNRRGTRTPISP